MTGPVLEMISVEPPVTESTDSSVLKDQQYQRAMATVERTLDKLRRCSPEEKHKSNYSRLNNFCNFNFNYLHP